MSWEVSKEKCIINKKVHRKSLHLLLLLTLPPWILEQNPHPLSHNQALCHYHKQIRGEKITAISNPLSFGKGHWETHSLKQRTSISRCRTLFLLVLFVCVPWTWGVWYHLLTLILVGCILVYLVYQQKKKKKKCKCHMFWISAESSHCLVFIYRWVAIVQGCFMKWLQKSGKEEVVMNGVNGGRLHYVGPMGGQMML